MTRSAASASIAPPPAAVPLSATITGFWQSWIDSISRWKPERIMWNARADHHVRRALGLRRHRRADPQVGAGAEVAVARAGQHHHPHREVGVGVLEVLDEPVPHVERDRVARTRPG